MKPDITRNPVTSSVTRSLYEEGDLMRPLRYDRTFSQDLADHTRTSGCWSGVVFIFLAVVGVVFIAAVIGTFAPH